jgi:hypothetical protein
MLKTYVFVSDFETRSETWWMLQCDGVPLLVDPNFFQDREGNWWYVSHNYHERAEGAQTHVKLMVEASEDPGVNVELIHL